MFDNYFFYERKRKISLLGMSIMSKKVQFSTLIQTSYPIFQDELFDYANDILIENADTFVRVDKQVKQPILMNNPVPIGDYYLKNVGTTLIRDEIVKQNLAKETRTQSKSRNSRVGLQSPVGRIPGLLRKGNNAERVGSGASVYLAAVLEHLSAEVLELVGNAAHDNKESRIIPGHLQFANRNNEEPDSQLSEVRGRKPFNNQNKTFIVTLCGLLLFSSNLTMV